MTLPNERTNSLLATREFLRDLLDPKKTPKVPRHIRERAARCLRHYPWNYDIKKLCELAPSILEHAEESDD